MGMIFDTITELAKLHKKSSNGIQLMAAEAGGIYYTYDEDHKPTEHRSLTELEGSEDWIAEKIKVIGFDEPEYQSMTMYWKDSSDELNKNKIVAIYPHKVKTASGKIVHLAN